MKHAREKQRLTQDALASMLGFNDRQTISDIENGKRALTTDELIKLSDALDQELEFFLDPFNVVAEAQYAWRASDDLPGAELDRFEATANGWVGMLRWLHQQGRDKQPDLGLLSLRLSANSTFEQAQNFGESLAKLLKLGTVPASTLPACLETQLGIPVLFVDMPPGLQPGAISGAACQVDAFSVILINRRESACRRHFDLAHELFHALTWEAMPPSRRESNAVEHRSKVKRVEQLANNFASALLMPTGSLDRFIDPARAMDVQHLADVAEQLQVTTHALGWRLTNLGRLDEPTRLALAKEKRQDTQELPKLFSAQFVEKLHLALDKGRLSARKAARTLGLPLFELTELFEAYGMTAPFEL
ncbi:XRE family transcriptional regulator [Massilia violaceinigra]|uniref:XRE family transcriptional regulator n=1 Tax=Massilia violaceinigra TaxID=2045208 RepID=UPI001FB47B8E|nr:XRE family transcriptional regulator [Massilia violaceinigra]